MSISNAVDVTHWLFQICNWFVASCVLGTLIYVNFNYKLKFVLYFLLLRINKCIIINVIEKSLARLKYLYTYRKVLS